MCLERRQEGKQMQVKAVIHEKYKETEIHVCSGELDGTTRKLVDELSEFVNTGLPVQRQNGDKTVIHEKDVICFFSEGQRRKSMRFQRDFTNWKTT